MVSCLCTTLTQMFVCRQTSLHHIKTNIRSVVHAFLYADRHGEANTLTETQAWRSKHTKRRYGEANMQIFNLSLRKHKSDGCSVYSTYLKTVMYPSTTQITLLLSQYTDYSSNHCLQHSKTSFFHNLFSLCCKQVFYSNIILLHGNLNLKALHPKWKRFFSVCPVKRLSNKQKNRFSKFYISIIHDDPYSISHSWKRVVK